MALHRDTVCVASRAHSECTEENCKGPGDFNKPGNDRCRYARALLALHSENQKLREVARAAKEPCECSPRPGHEDDCDTGRALKALEGVDLGP